MRVLSLFLHLRSFLSFFFHDPPTTEIYTLSLHDALPISNRPPTARAGGPYSAEGTAKLDGSASSDLENNVPLSRSEEHTSELQSLTNLVCRLLLEKKKNNVRYNE